LAGLAVGDAQVLRCTNLSSLGAACGSLLSFWLAALVLAAER